MPQYIQPLNPQLMQALLQAQAQKSARPGRTAAAIGEAVKKVVDNFYAEKEKKALEAVKMIQAKKEFDQKEGMMRMQQEKQEADIAEKFKFAGPESPGQADILAATRQFTAGNISPEQARMFQPKAPEGFEKTIGSLAKYGKFVQPRGKEFKPETSIGESGSKAFRTMGIDIPAETPVSVANIIGRQKIAERRATAYGKVNQGYKSLSAMVMKLPGIPYKLWTPQDKVNYAAWLKKTREDGITIEDVAVISEDAAPEEKTFWQGIMSLIGWKAPAETKPVPKPAPAVDDRTRAINWLKAKGAPLAEANIQAVIKKKPTGY